MKKIIILIVVVVAAYGIYAYTLQKPKAVEVISSSPAKAFLETMKKDLGISSQVLASTGRMGLADGTIANNINGYRLSYSPQGKEDNSYISARLRPDGLATNSTELSQGYTDGNISCEYGAIRSQGTHYVFCIDLEGVTGEGPGADFRG